MDSATVDGAQDVAAVAQHSCFPYLFFLIWFSRSGAAHTISSPYDGTGRVAAVRRRTQALRSPIFFYTARALENA